MFFTGLTSVSFRNLGFQEVISIAKNGQLDGIEWGSDVHIPLFDIENADAVKKATVRAGLKILSYGSFFKAGDNFDAAKAFLPVIDCAKTLNTQNIRIWAGSKSSDECYSEYYQKILADTKTASNIAWRAGKTLCLEYHKGTFADSRFSVLKLLKEAECDNLKTNWMPNPKISYQENVEDLIALLPYLENINVFNASADGNRIPLENAEQEWKNYIDLAKKTAKNRCFILEFFKHDGVDQFYKDTKTLNTLVRGEVKQVEEQSYSW